MDTVVKVAPTVAAHWEDIGYRLKLKDEDIDGIELDVSRSGDTRSACKKVMRTWMKSVYGKEPKIWRTFVMVLKELDIDCGTVLEVLQGESVH